MLLPSMAQVDHGHCAARAGDKSYGGMVHVVVGMAGQELSINILDEKPEIYDRVDVEHYGLTVLTANATHLSMRLYGDVDGTVLDEFVLTAKA